MTARLYESAIEMARGVGALSRRIQRFDPELARRLRRASGGVPLSLTDRSGSREGASAPRLRASLAAAQEVRACLQIAVAAGYLPTPLVAPARERLDRLLEVLARLTS